MKNTARMVRAISTSPPMTAPTMIPVLLFPLALLLEVRAGEEEVVAVEPAPVVVVTGVVPFWITI